MKSPPSLAPETDVVLVGSGIMSASLGALLKRLDPARRIQVFEAASELAPEASHGWNNAGTGHAGLCELSYTPHRSADGTVDVSNALRIFHQFGHTLQFCARAVESGMIDRPADFVNPVPHVSFVHGAEQVDYLRARHAALIRHPEFADMEFTADPAVIAQWAPLLLEGRDPAQPVAATCARSGTDINFGALARKLLQWLERQPGCAVSAGCRVTGLERAAGGWIVRLPDRASGRERACLARFVFAGAGGGSLPLLQKADLPQARGLGGFPIGGQWLVCDNPAVVARHHAKVYGQALATAPTMAVPHLDARVLDGRRVLLFGPFAAWTTKFLHRTGSLTDLPRSIRPHNLATLLRIGAGNLGLIRYLLQQGTQGMADRMEVLRLFYPKADPADWRLVDAGIRVQAIKQTDGEAGIVHYGTEVITASDGSMAALLGASPGASVCVNIVLEVIRKSFPHLIEGEAVRRRLQELVPTYGVDYRKPELASKFNELAANARRQLQLNLGSLNQRSKG
jgi:malate dehydrogenase (quinone)